MRTVSTERLRFELYIAQKGRCANCRVKLTLKPRQRNTIHLDHINPRSKGGTDEACNRCLLCAMCNFSKHARLSPGMQLTVFDKAMPASPPVKTGPGRCLLCGAPIPRQRQRDAESRGKVAAYDRPECYAAAKSRRARARQREASNAGER